MANTSSLKPTQKRITNENIRPQAQTSTRQEKTNPISQAAETISLTAMPSPSPKIFNNSSSRSKKLGLHIKNKSNRIEINPFIITGKPRIKREVSKGRKNRAMAEEKKVYFLYGNILNF